MIIEEIKDEARIQRERKQIAEAYKKRIKSLSKYSKDMITSIGSNSSVMNPDEILINNKSLRMIKRK